MASADVAIIEDRLLLHGVASLDALDVIGSGKATFAGVQVRAIKEGTIAALVSMAPPVAVRPRWLQWVPRSAPPNMTPTLSALSTLIPVLPVAFGTVFEGEGPLRHMLSSREGEIGALIKDHSGLLECDLAAGFNSELAETELMSQAPFTEVNGKDEIERALLKQQLAQSVAGRQATFLARLNRRVVDGAIDLLPVEGRGKGGAMRRRVLLARGSRAEFRASVNSLAFKSGPGAWLRAGPFLPPISFRRLEISSADVARVSEARAALGVEEAVDRSMIRTAYQRTIERNYARAPAEERRQRLNQLKSLFGLLELVADGQIKAARGNETVIRFDADALKATWLLRFHQHDLADKAA